MTLECVRVVKKFTVITHMVSKISSVQSKWMLLSHFQWHHHHSVGSNNNGILIATASVPPHPLSTQGVSYYHHHPPLAICMEKAATMSFPLVFFFLYHSQLFSPPHFQLNCDSIHGAAHTPWVDKGNKSPPLPSPACKLCGEGGDGEFSSPF